MNFREVPETETRELVFSYPAPAIEGRAGTRLIAIGTREDVLVSFRFPENVEVICALEDLAFKPYQPKDSE